MLELKSLLGIITYPKHLSQSFSQHLRFFHSPFLSSVTLSSKKFQTILRLSHFHDKRLFTTLLPTSHINSQQHSSLHLLPGICCFIISCYFKVNVSFTAIGQKRKTKNEKQLVTRFPNSIRKQKMKKLQKRKMESMK